jgi:hypothetical protein
MGSLERRLQRLESRSGPPRRAPGGTDGAQERSRTRLFYALDNARRERHGEGPRDPTDKEREALEAERESERPAKPPWYTAAAWEERERRFRCLFAELDRLEETVSREETR